MTESIQESETSSPTRAAGIRRGGARTFHAAARRTCASLAFAAALAAGTLATGGAARAAGQENRDVVQLKSGATELGKVKSEEYGGLDIDPTKGESKRIPWSEISGVTYADAEYQSAKDLIDAGKFEDAAAALAEMAGDSKLRAPIKQNVLYFQAFALQRQNKLDEALAAYRALLQAFPKSRWLMEVGEAIVAIHVAKKDLAGAGRALDQLSSDALTAGVEASFGTGVSVLKARLFEEQKKWAEAAAAYGTAARSSGLPPAVQLQAELGEARCAVALNKKTDAEAMYRKIAGKDAPNHVLAGAWNGLGELALERGRAANNGKGDAELILDALYMYLRGVVQYAPLPGQPTNEYERALAGASDCFKFLGQLETKADVKRLYAERSAQRVNQLKKEFPNSAYLQGR